MIDSIVIWFEKRRALSTLRSAGLVSPDLQVGRGVIVEIEKGAKVKIANRVSIGPYSIIRVTKGATLEIAEGVQLGARSSVYCAVHVTVQARAILGDGVVVTDSDPVQRAGKGISSTAISGTHLVVPESALIPPNTLINSRSRAVQGGHGRHGESPRGNGGDNRQDRQQRPRQDRPLAANGDRPERGPRPERAGGDRDRHRSRRDRPERHSSDRPSNGPRPEGVIITSSVSGSNDSSDTRGIIRPVDTQADLPIGALNGTKKDVFADVDHTEIQSAPAAPVIDLSIGPVRKDNPESV